MAKWRDSGDLTAGQMVDLPPIWLMAMLGLVWGQTQVLPGLTLSLGPLRSVGAALIVLGIVLMLWAVAVFRSHQTSVVPHQVPVRIITTGPFRRSRNPIYLGDVMVLTGAVLWWGAWPSLVLIPVFVAILVRRFIAPEEARMKQNFGPEFDRYAEKTPRWL